MNNPGRKSSSQFSAMALLIGEPARATMLWRLLGGKAFTATELAISADISAQSASMHLTKLVKANLLSVVSQGRHKYYQLSGPEVAYVLESISNLVPTDKLVADEPEPVNGNDIKFCRTCYDHLAGRVGVAVTDGLVEKKIIVGSGKHDYEVTAKGIKWFDDLNISANDLMKQRRVFARKCLDWSERRHHLSGSLGAALLEEMIKMKWMSKQRNSRIILLTAMGQKKLYDLLGLSL